MPLTGPFVKAEESYGHHFGEVSIPQVTHFLSIGSLTDVNDSPSGRPAEELRLARVAAFAADLRLVAVGSGCTGGATSSAALVASSRRFALRVVPVRVRSACL